MIAEGLVVVRPGRGVEQAADDGDVLGVHLALHLEPGHGRRLPAWPYPQPVGRPRTVKGQAREVLKRLAVAYPDAVCELDYRNPFELLAATILSAQTTDVRVNMVTPALFARYPDAEALAVANPREVEEIIRSTGFYQNKTRSLLGMAQALLERFDGDVPTRLEDLVTMPGRGPQDRQRRAQRRLRSARAPGRHPRDAPVPAPRADDADGCRSRSSWS